MKTKMMTEPKKKAKKLVDRFNQKLLDVDTPMNLLHTYCALIFIDDMRDETMAYGDDHFKRWEFWDETRKEVEKL